MGAFSKLHPCKWHFFHSNPSTALKIYARGPGRERGNALMMENRTKGAAELSSPICLRGGTGSPWPSLCGNRTSAANLWLTFDSKWGYCCLICDREMKHWHFGWQTDVLFVTWLSGCLDRWTAVWMDFCQDGFTPTAENESSQQFWLNYSNKQENWNDFENPRNLTIIGILCFWKAWQPKSECSNNWRAKRIREENKMMSSLETKRQLAGWISGFWRAQWRLY